MSQSCFTSIRKHTDWLLFLWSLLILMQTMTLNEIGGSWIRMNRYRCWSCDWLTETEVLAMLSWFRDRRYSMMRSDAETGVELKAVKRRLSSDANFAQRCWQWFGVKIDFRCWDWSEVDTFGRWYWFRRWYWLWRWNWLWRCADSDIASRTQRLILRLELFGRRSWSKGWNRLWCRHWFRRLMQFRYETSIRTWTWFERW